VKKNRLNFWKNRSLRFQFYKSETEKTEPNRIQTEKNRAKPEKTEPNQKNQAKPVWTGFCPKKMNRTETDRFEPVSVWFQFFFVWLLFFFDKNRIEPKMITPSFYQSDRQMSWFECNWIKWKYKEQMWIFYIDIG
jgi:hypothetical protein